MANKIADARRSLIRAKELEEIRQAALEAGLCFDLLHLRADAFHLAQADGVDSPWHEPRGCQGMDLVLVPCFPIGPVAAGDALAAIGDVTLDEKFVEPAERWRCLIAINSNGLASQTVLVLL